MALLAQGTGQTALLSQPPVIQATFTDAKGETTTFETDAVWRVTKQIHSLTWTTTIQRDPQGNPLTIRGHASGGRLCSFDDL